TSADIIGTGRCRSYWLFESNSWLKVSQEGYSNLIFDKFSPINKRIRTSRKLLFSSKRVKPFNNPYIFNLFFDKQKTYIKLHKYSIPTVAIIDSTRQSIYRACKTLKEIMSKHPHQNDFSDEVIMKNRFGAGGRKVHKFKANKTKGMMVQMKRHEKISYIIQPFVKFDKGFSYKNSPVSADIRLIYLGGKIIQTYIRMAKTGDFRCNEHQGGSLKYISRNEVPQEVKNLSNKIANVLNKKSSLYALDFVISNNGNIYLLEGNTGPGLDWNLSIKENEIEAKKLIRIIVKELVRLKETYNGLVDMPLADEYPTLSNELVLA
ncbi:MAG: ATP-grasp domain-containing protein, partial [Patescibacteria group bacterium]